MLEIFAIGTIRNKAIFISEQNSDEIKKALIKMIEYGELDKLKDHFCILINQYNSEIRWAHQGRDRDGFRVLPQAVIDADWHNVDGPGGPLDVLARGNQILQNFGGHIPLNHQEHAENLIQLIDRNNSHLKSLETCINIVDARITAATARKLLNIIDKKSPFLQDDILEKVSEEFIKARPRKLSHSERQTRREQEQQAMDEEQRMRCLGTLTEGEIIHRVPTRDNIVERVSDARGRKTKGRKTRKRRSRRSRCRRSRRSRCRRSR